MSSPYLAEIRIFSFGFAPKGWAQCNGQLLPINQNQALFSLLGTFYGGNGQTTFALPNLQGAFPVHMGTNSVNGIAYAVGNTGGESAHTLQLNEMPSHTHAAMSSPTAGNSGVPTGNVWAAGNNIYNNLSQTTMASSALSTLNGGQPHQNLPPYLALNFCIALSGIFPSRS